MTDYVDTGRAAQAHALQSLRLGEGMPRQGSRRTAAWVLAYRRRAVPLDVLSAAVAAGVAFCTRSAPHYYVADYALLSVGLPIAWVLALWLAHGYESRFIGVAAEEYRAVFRAALGIVVLIGLGSYAAGDGVARRYTLIAIVSTLLLDLVARNRLRHWLAGQRWQGLRMQRTVVVGRADSAAALIEQLKGSPTHGLEVVAACVSGLDASWESASQIHGVPVFGTPEEALSAVDLFNAAVVAVSSHPDLVGHSLRRLGWSLEERDVELIVSPGILEVAGPRLSIRPLAGLSLLHVERPVSTGGLIKLKSIADFFLAIAFLLVLSPILLAAALAVKLSSPGPILFRQNRVGARGELFSMLKFRTMVVDAEERLVDLEGGNDINSVLFKRKDDPRITPVGRILRRYSIDELPQLVNVVTGDMSLVGPRPPLPREVALYEPDAVRRLRVQPGLTGLWQVSGRSNLSWDESLRLDLWYVDNWCLLLDLQILFRTLRAVLRGSGAY